MIARLRLWSGMTLFVYATLHLLNHALLLGSLSLANDALTIFTALWRSPIGTAILYGALLTHVGLVLWSVFRRRHLRLRPWEWAQLALGFLILPVGMLHAVATRGGYTLYDIRADYVFVLLAAGQGLLSALQQFALVLIVWIHGCIGLHAFWRLRPWYQRWLPTLFGAAVALPALALAGAVVGIREAAAIAADPDRLREALRAINLTDDHTAALYAIADALKIGVIALIAATMAARPLRDIWERRGGVVRAVYSAERTVVVPAGPSLLEISRGAGIPHAAVCGGRGRCSTCRTRIGGADRSRLPAPGPQEARVLARINAPPNVRLACQVHPPPGEYLVSPLMTPTVGPSEAWRRSPGHGSERVIAVLFADIRGFTTLSEGRLPFDVVFVINRYFRAMGSAVEAAGGHVDKFIGDGVMALFGVDGDAAHAARQALDAARRMSLALKELNDALAADLELQLRIGIGIHAGPAIVGEMGYGQAMTLTAIGDMVNIASRLEGMTKELTCEMVVSDDLVTRAGVTLPDAPRHEIDVRGRSGRLAVYAVADASVLAMEEASTTEKATSPAKA